MKILREIPYFPLVVIAVVLGLAPFRPEPHLVEKARMLFAGDLVRPIDVFDLFFHAAPLILLILKLTVEAAARFPRNER